MAKRKQTETRFSLNPFNESLVKIISASVSYNRGGRCVLTRVFQSVDGEIHTSNLSLDADAAYAAIEQTYGQLGHVDVFVDKPTT